MRTSKIVLSVLFVLSILITACGAGTSATQAPAAGSEPVTLRVLVHQNPPMVDFMNTFNAKFQEKYPNITIDMAVVNANDLSTVTQTRLTANDVDVVDMFGFSNAAQPYMKNVDPPNWQALIQAGLLMDITDQPFLKNYDPSAIEDAGSFEGKVYAINLGRVSYSGVYYNKDMFAANNVKVPTTWAELVTACETFKAANIPCMTAGGKDGWPIFVGAYGLLGAEYPDQAGLVQGLWEGTVKWNDATSLDMWKKMQIYARDMMEEGASGVAADAAPGRFASGAVAMFPSGTWSAAAIETSQPAFQWGYIPFPGSDSADANKYLFGKYDQGWAVAAKTPNKDAAMLYLSEFSDPANYQAFVTAVGFIPTQPGAKLDTQIGQEVAPYLANFRVGYEQYWVAPKGTGQWASPFASFFKPFNEWDDAAKLADQAQADLQAGLDANK
ncbi:extracellular solute-binding protein [Candidatus Villigracilis saccharophilus]|uniref:ABC transporter substrate-binding protein n=1 Tax=Candidatus Villigracilis saccharophilus TaxID=3140684 RepID=UPI00313685C8|nr:extracellular solute-binding protein [Anaerolineales bacterium]